MNNARNKADLEAEAREFPVLFEKALDLGVAPRDVTPAVLTLVREMIAIEKKIKAMTEHSTMKDSLGIVCKICRGKDCVFTKVEH